MKLVSTRSELEVLRASCSKKPVISGTALQGIDETYFNNSFTKEILKFILKTNRDRGSPPLWTEVCEEPTIKDDTRKRIKEATIERLKTPTDVKAKVVQLNKYRQLRGIFQIAEDSVESLKGRRADPDEILTEIATQVVGLRQRKSDTNEVLVFGKGNNSKEMVASLLSLETIDYLPTGFDAFDTENGGIGFGNLFVLGGSTGAGKSALSAQISYNWADMGEDVVMVPLEMSKKEMTARTMANASNIDVRKILFNKMSEDEIKVYWKKYKKFIRKKKKAGGSFKIFKPDQDMTIEEIMASIHPLGCRVAVIDYISLLKDVDGDDAWQKLGAVARYCKVYAETHNMIIVLLCQVSDEGLIRYARAIAEHANYCLVGETLVRTSQGYRKIENLCPDIKSKSIKDGIKVQSGKHLREVSITHNNGIRNVFEVRTRHGLNIQGTKDHKVAVLGKDFSTEWKEIGKLVTGDFLVVPTSRFFSTKATTLGFVRDNKISTYNGREYKHECTWPTKMTNELARLVGYLLGDGYVSSSHLGFVCQEKETILDFATCFKTCFGVDIKISYGKTYSSVRSDRPVICDFFKHLGGLYKLKSDKKHLSDYVVNSTKEHLTECLRTLLNSDGHFNSSRASYCTVSNQLAHEVQMSLLHLGIVSLRNYKIPSKENNPYYKTAKPQNILSVNDGKSLEILYRDLLPVSIRKRHKPKKASFYAEQFPLLRKLLEEKGFKSLNLLKAKKFSGSPIDEIPTHKNIEFQDELRKFDDRLFAKVKQLAKQNLLFTPVIEILPKGKKKVYDLTVPDVHAFNANGIYVHNCWTFVATRTTREHQIMNISQLKARNGRIFDFTLRALLDVMRVRDLELEEKEEIDAKTKKGSKKKKFGKKDVDDEGDGKKKKGSKASKDYLKDLSDEDDD